MLVILAVVDSPVVFVNCHPDPNVESRLPILQSLSIYVPRDERFSHIKFSDLLAFAVKSVAHFLIPAAEGQFDSTPGEFDNFQEILKVYEGGIKLQKNQFIESVMESVPSEMLRELLRTDSDGFLKFPKPQVIKGKSIISIMTTTLDYKFSFITMQLCFPYFSAHWSSRR